jgi:magnesium-transporting ATPase (P-type)
MNEPRPWHALPPEEVLTHHEAHPDGLSSAMAEERLRRYGPNALPTAPPPSLFQRVLAQCHNLLIYVLLVAVVITAWLDHWVDSGVILAVVVINIAIGVLQEGKAERAMEAIRHMLSPRAVVWRDGRSHDIPATELVPGDIVAVASGDRLPADVRLLQANRLRVDEAMLTGESVPVDKQVDAVAADVPLGDRQSMAYAGTLVTQGQARAVVVATGSQTEMGRIGRLLASVEQAVTPLVRNMAQMSRWVTGAVLGAALLLFVFGTLVRGMPMGEMFMIAVGLAVAAIPEGLPAIMTITLAIGVQRMARRHAVVRQLPAVETLGAVTVICSDKTGTLTRNEMMVQAVLVPGQTVQVDGAGYEPQGTLWQQPAHGPRHALQPAELYAESPALLALAECAALCNDAQLHETASGWQLTGDPTEGALLALAMKAGLSPTELAQERPRLASIPFESEHRYMATLHAGVGTAPPCLLVKGAPERLLALCQNQLGVHGQPEPLDLARWQDAIDAQARQGRRVLALAHRSMEVPTTAPDGRIHPTPGHALTPADLDGKLTLLGLVGIIDPPREEAIRAVAACRSAGIRVKMITGDHGATATAIAQQLGMLDTVGSSGQDKQPGQAPAPAHRTLTGPEIEAMDDAALQDAVQRADVFARASPEHKLRLVQALQARGEVVAMTGDGVNDAPALKQADVGVAMGQKGTEAAKQAGAIVLADDNFASIAHAVEEGRTVYDNLRKTITFLLPMNGGESLSLLAAVLLGVAMPILPVQILWVNMVSSVALAMVLAFEPTESGVMQRPPRPPSEPMLTPFIVWRILLVSGLFLSGIFGVFQWALAQGYSVELARTLAVNTLVAMEVFYLFSVRYLTAPSFTLVGLKGTRLVLLAVAGVLTLQMGFTFLPFMNTLFGTAPLALPLLFLCAGLGVLVLVVLELEKLILRRWRTA